MPRSRADSAAIEIDAVLLLEMQPDQRGVRDDRAAVVDVRQLAFRRAQEALGARLVFELRELEQHLALHDEGAGIGQPEERAERVQRDHGS